MPTQEEIKDNIKRLLKLLDGTSLGLPEEWEYFGHDELKALEKEINTFIGLLEKLRTMVKLYVKLRPKD